MKKETNTTTERAKYPYVEITQIEGKKWQASLVTDEYWHWSDYNYKLARTRGSAERKGRRMLDKWNKKYGNLADPYRIR
jgi:hypothetical protein